MGFETRSVNSSICVLATVPPCLTMCISISYVLGSLHILSLILTTILEIGDSVSHFGDKETVSRKTSKLPKGTFFNTDS